MPPKLRLPSYVKTITLPVFGMDWFGQNGDSIVAYCGGGGSAKTGVNNKIMLLLNGGEDEITISTGDQVCVAVNVYQEHSTGIVWLLGAIGNDVVRYKLPECEEAGRVTVGGGCNALAVHAMGEVFAVGCDDGMVHVYNFGSNGGDWQKLFQCEGHVKCVCSIQFALRSSLLISSAKDGTARVWKQGGECIAVLQCDITDPKAPPPKIKPSRPAQVLVRGCAFGDLEGKAVYTVASGRKGKAFLTRWLADPAADGSYKIDIRTDIHPCPISAMSLSKDAGLLALGGVDGTIILFNVGTWKKLKQFKELHELPVTCIAARPYATPLNGDTAVPLHAISASADSQMGMLTLINKVPKKPSAASTASATGSPSTLTVLLWLLVVYFSYVIGSETVLLCGTGDNSMSLDCVYHTVLIAPSSRPGILVPPY
jgi:WD40 repeat protein